MGIFPASSPKRIDNGSDDLIYICDCCHFEFERMSEVEQCPDCGKMAIRMAAEEESIAFRNRLKESTWLTSDKTEL